jgi:beta-xylosidase
MISEGGTFEDHMITVARSKDLFGPYEPNPNNPILTHRGTDEYIQHTGHCEMFCDKEGQWWCVCLAVRKDPKGRYIMGRETFLTPGTWPEGEWPTLERVKIDPASAYGRQLAKASSLITKPLLDLCYIRDVNLANHKISSDGHKIELTTSKDDFSNARGEISFVGKRQRTLKGRASVTLDTHSPASSSKNGLAVYKDEFRYARIYIDAAKSEIVQEVVNEAKKIDRSSRKHCANTLSVGLVLEYEEDSYSFSFTTSGDQASFDAFDSMDMVGPDFVGPIIGVFSVAAGGHDTGGSAVFLDLAVQ